MLEILPFIGRNRRAQRAHALELLTNLRKGAPALYVDGRGELVAPDCAAVYSFAPRALPSASSLYSSDDLARAVAMLDAA